MRITKYRIEKKHYRVLFFCLLLDMQMSRSKLPCRQVWVNWMNLKGQSISCAFILGIFFPGKKMYVFRALHSLFFVLEISSIFPCIIGTGESRSCLESSCDLLGKIHQNNFLFLPYLLVVTCMYGLGRTEYTVVENWNQEFL